jgi:hypothetical protein
MTSVAIKGRKNKVRIAERDLIMRFMAEYNHMLSNFRPLEFASTIKDEIFQSALLESYYRKRTEESRADSLDMIVAVLNAPLRIPHHFLDSFYLVLDWDLQNFRNQRRSVSKEYTYVHQLQVSSIASAYVSKLSKGVFGNDDRQVLLIQAFSMIH